MTEALPQTGTCPLVGQQPPPLGQWYLDLPAGRLHWSEAACRIFEVEPGDLESGLDRWLQCIHPEDRAGFEQAFGNLVETGEGLCFEHRMPLGDGRVKHIVVYGEVVRYDSGRIIQARGTVQDISVLRRAEEALRQSEDRFWKLADLYPVGIFRTDTRGNCLFVNSAWCEMAGMEPAQALGGGWGAALHPDDRDRVFEAWYRAAEEGRMPFHTECRFLRPDGRVTWVLARADQERDASGEVTGYVGTVTDINEAKGIETALREIAATISGFDGGSSFFDEMTRRLARLFSVDFAFIGLLDPEDSGKINTQSLFARGRHRENMSYWLDDTPCANVVGHATCVYPAGVQQEFPADRLLTRMGAESYIGTPLFDEQGRPMGLVVLMHSEPLRDVWRIRPIMEIVAARVGAEMERHRALQALREHEDHLEQLVAERTRELEAFSYSVSHDLRAPLRGINGFAQALLEDYGGQLDEEGRDYLLRVKRASERMGELIDDLLQLSRVSRSQLQVVSCDISRIAMRLLAELQEQEPERRVQVKVAPGLRADGDEKLLTIMLSNLLDNAWKYSRLETEARIEVGNCQEQEAFFVRDNGTGFDMRYADKLFNAFQRLHGREFEGTGIGLATVQRIVHKHGGRAWAEAEPGRGACFYFTLPAAVSATYG